MALYAKSSLSVTFIWGFPAQWYLTKIEGTL